MHKIFITNGLVLAKRGVGEGGSLLAVLTRELGLLRASARSTRVERSKLRYGLEPFTLGRFSFVKGRHEWRLVGVERVSRECLPQNINARRAAGRAARLLLRLVQGQEPSAELFETVVEGLACFSRISSAEYFPKNSSDLAVQEHPLRRDKHDPNSSADAPASPTIDSVECVLVLRILAHLGYLPRTPEISPFIEADFFSLELAHETARSRTLLVRLINDSLQATGL